MTQDFANPPARLRGIPFWCWNNRLDRDKLFRQLEAFTQMGFGGVVIHARTGLETEYLGLEFLETVRACVARAETLGLAVWLYDEDRWPSGFAGGKVTSDPAFRSRYLLFTPHSYEALGASSQPNVSQARGARTGKGCLLARYEIHLEDGFLKHYRRLQPGEASRDGREWFAYLETARPSAWFGGQTYVDTLNPKAIDRFIESTYEAYRAALSESWGQSVPGIFTDEPQMAIKSVFAHSTDATDLVFPWTDDLPETFAATFHQSLEDHLPELFWERTDGRPSQIRYRFFEHTTERFARAFSDRLGAWCRENGILLTGHLMMEGELYNQAQSVGESMRHYRAFDLPGIDLLCDWREYNTAKQAQSAARQFGRPGVMSELYGVTGWDFTFAGHKAQGDWQAALGVTHRMHHLAWMSMAGEAKRDYPASIFTQSPWWKEYDLIESHFARVRSLLERGKASVRVAVIHPIESYWLAFGPRDKTTRLRAQLEDNYNRLTDWLLFGLIDFDFLCESLLPGLCPQPAAAPLAVGQSRYDVVIVPPLRTIRQSTLDILQKFACAGGEILMMGPPPRWVDAVESSAADWLAHHAREVPFGQGDLLGALETRRELDILDAEAKPAVTLFHQIRQDKNKRHLFVCNTDRDKPLRNASVRLRGLGTVTAHDTLTGQSQAVPVEHLGGWTCWTFDFEAHGHGLFTHTPAEITPAPRPVRNWQETSRLHSTAITRDEPNVLLLDRARWRLDGGDWQPEEELLRLGNRLCSHFGIPTQHGDIAQPWTDRAPTPHRGWLDLSFPFDADLPLDHLRLVVEQPETIAIAWNGGTAAARTQKKAPSQARFASNTARRCCTTHNNNKHFTSSITQQNILLTH